MIIDSTIYQYIWWGLHQYGGHCLRFGPPPSHTIDKWRNAAFYQKIWSTIMAWRGPKSKAMATILAYPTNYALINYGI